jgi:hypothetical protein
LRVHTAQGAVARSYCAGRRCVFILRGATFRVLVCASVARNVLGAKKKIGQKLAHPNRAIRSAALTTQRCVTVRNAHDISPPKTFYGAQKYWVLLKLGCWIVGNLDFGPTIQALKSKYPTIQHPSFSRTQNIAPGSSRALCALINRGTSGKWKSAEEVTEIVAPAKEVSERVVAFLEHQGTTF